jgi:SAM-dependent methyltransferase
VTEPASPAPEPPGGGAPVPGPAGEAPAGGSRWATTAAPRGEEYDARWRAMAARGENPHGEADFVDDLLRRTRAPADAAILDGGCGTGRVAVELARRGYQLVGLDLDAAMLAVGRAKPEPVEWVLGDLATASLGRTFAAVVLAGNVMIFVASGSEGAVLANLAGHLTLGGLLVAGFQLRDGRLTLVEHDRLAAAAGLELAERWATWDREPWTGDGAYAVSVHRRER